MTLDEFHDYVEVLNDRFSSNWRMMNEENPEEWPLENGISDWIEQLFSMIDDDCP